MATNIDDLWDDMDDSELLSIPGQVDEGTCGEHTDGVSSAAIDGSDSSLDRRGRRTDPSRDAGYPTPLKLLRSGYLWVSDFTSQLWCEQQLVYKYTLPAAVVETPVMTAGSNIHLARELEVQDVVKIQVTSSEDIFAIKVLNLLGAVASFIAGCPVRREIPIFGLPFGYDVFVMGLIDEIRCDSELFMFDIYELKTRKTKYLPSKSQKLCHNMQVMIYKKLFDDLVLGKFTKDDVKRHLGLNLEQKLGLEVQKEISHAGLSCSSLTTLVDELFNKMKCLPCVSQMFIEYCHQESNQTIAIESVQYDETLLHTQVDTALSYWQGKREPVGVDIEDAWKCQNCDFADDCQWRERKSEECKNKNKLS